MNLLEYYQNRFGPAVKKQGVNSWNGPCPICGGNPGKSDRFMVSDRQENLGKICTENHISGIWSCRRCGAGGDTLAYLMKVEGMDFKAALAELGIQGKRTAYVKPRPLAAREETAPVFTPREWNQPSAVWMAYAEKLATEAHESLGYMKPALDWLSSRGIDKQAMSKYRLGYLFEENDKCHGRFRPRKVLDLAPRQDKDGKVHDKLFIPRGITIPTFGKSGVINLHIRRHNVDIGKNLPKYLELEGGSHVPFMLMPAREKAVSVFFIVEAELDAMLIHYIAGGAVGAIAMRSNRNKPDKAAFAILQKASRIVLAMDFDDAGVASLSFWEQTFPEKVLLWPVPQGKDPGEAFGLGVDMAAWIASALPPSVSLVEKKPEPAIQQPAEKPAAQTDASTAGPVNKGSGDRPEKPYRDPLVRWSKESDFTAAELKLLKNALPSKRPLDSIPLGVARSWLLWRGLDITYVKHDILAWWDSDRFRQPRKFAQFDAFRDYEKPDLWWWLNRHPASEITWRNLFEV